MIEPKKYKTNNSISKREILNNNFRETFDYYFINKNLYGNSIVLKLMISKDDNHIIVNVSDNYGCTYAPFYNPECRHNNLVYMEVVKNFNNFMDTLVSKGLFKYEDEIETIKNYSNAYEKIKIRYLSDIKKIESIPNGDLIDLRVAKDISMKKGEFQLIPLGIAMKLPKGYKANIYPRSSTYKNFGIVMANSVGQVDESYCGNSDEWMFPAIALRNTVIHKNDRICQFEIQKKQPEIQFIEVNELDGVDRGGFGSTGKE